MRKPNTKVVRITALASAAAFALLPMTAASAAAVNASAFGAKVTVLNSITVGPLPTSTLPPGGPSAVVPVDLGTLGNVAAVYANTAGDANAGTSTATAGTANLNLLGTATVIPIYAIHANAISSTCTADGPNVSGSTTVANLRLGLHPVINLTDAQQQNVIVIPGIASVIIGEQIHNADGSLTVNALHITVLKGDGADVILGSSTCGPNAAVLPVSAFSFQDLPIILGGIALVVLIGFGIRTGVRRLGSAA